MKWQWAYNIEVAGSNICLVDVCHLSDMYSDPRCGSVKNKMKQDSKFEPWRCEAEQATSRSRRLPTILNLN